MTIEINLDLTVGVEKELSANLTNYGGFDLVANYSLIADLDNYVPYTGATKDIELGSKNIILTAGAGVIFQPVAGTYFQLYIDSNGEIKSQQVTP